MAYQSTNLSGSYLPPANLWLVLQRIVVIIIGALLCALGYALFQMPFNLVMGGVIGIAIMLDSFLGLGVGLISLILNIPLMVVGYFYLGRRRFLFYTLIAVTTFSLTADWFVAILPGLLEKFPLSNDMLLNSVYAGIVVGIGNGLIFRAGGTLAGTNVIGRIVQKRKGLPLSQVYMYTDSLVMLATGFVFGWNIALHGILAIFLSGIATDFALEGPSMVRSVMIITNHPATVAQALMVNLNQGASHWYVTGSYTGRTHALVWCTVLRSQVSEMKRIVAGVDPYAFVVVGNAHQALGGGFQRLKQQTLEVD